MPLQFDVFSVFPSMFESPFAASIIRRAQDRQIIQLSVHDIRNWTSDRHRTVDDTPYGGGAGMVMMAPPIVNAVESILGEDLASSRVIVMSAAGRSLTQAAAQDLATASRIAIICGRYEGIDDRVVQVLRAEEISIGDYILTGGEIPAMVVVDAVTRLIPGVISSQSARDDSFTEDLLEHPHFTHPAVFRGLSVPAILHTGHHAEISAWRRTQARRRTAERRPDLLQSKSLDDAEPLEP